MEAKRHFDVAVIVYFSALLIYAVINFFSRFSLLDLMYSFAVISCMARYFVVIYRDRK